MTDAPERIWAEQSGYFKKDGIYYNRGRWSDDEESGMAPFIRVDLHKAAVAAARVEGMRAAASIAANACLVDPDGGNPTEEERLVCEEAYRRIIAAAEASK